MRKILFSALFVLTSLCAFAQANRASSAMPNNTIFKADAAQGYYVKDGRVYYAWINSEREQLRATRLYIPQQIGHDEAIFSPEEVSEWGIEESGSKRYVSVKIETEEGEKWYFMEDLQKTETGSNILFLSRAVMPDETYFLYENGTATELATRRNPAYMWEYFTSLNDCTKEWTIATRYPKRLRVGMVKRYYNAFAYCNEKMFPQPRFGITASVGAARPTVFDERSGELVHFDDGTLDRILTYGRTEYQFNVAFSAGIFFRFPIEEVMSFQPEIQYYYQSNKGVLGNPWLHPAARTKIGFETHSVRAPLLFRFTNNYAKKRLMPYAELGPVFYANFGSYWIDKYKDKQRGLPIFTVGVAIGVGMEYYINASQAFSIGARFNWMSNVGGRERIYNNLNFELVAGFSLFKM